MNTETFAVITTKGATVQTFDDRKRAFRFAEVNAQQFGRLDVIRIERIERRTRLKTVRWSPPVCPADGDLAIPGAPA